MAVLVLIFAVIQLLVLAQIAQNTAPMNNYDAWRSYRARRKSYPAIKRLDARLDRWEQIRPA
jgi:hypothetical protein